MPTLSRIVDEYKPLSPGKSVATLKIPPLPDDAMDALIAAMGNMEAGGA